MLKNLTALRKGIWRFQLHCRDCDFSYQECNINNYVCVRLWKRSPSVLTGSACCWLFVQSPWKLLDPKKFEKKEELHITLRIGNTLPTLQHIANTATHCQHSKKELKNRTQSTQYHNYCYNNILRVRNLWYLVKATAPLAAIYPITNSMAQREQWCLGSYESSNVVDACLNCSSGWWVVKEIRRLTSDYQYHQWQPLDNKHTGYNLQSP